MTFDWTTALNDIGRQAVDGLEQSGAHTLDPTSLSPADSGPFLRDITRAVTLLGSSEGMFVPLRLRGLFVVGLSAQALAIAAAYLGKPPALTALHLRRDIGTRVPVDLRCWHRDAEDVRMIRMIVYTHDVDASNGPFEYIPRHAMTRCADLAERATGDPNSNPEYRAILDDEMRAVVPEAEWSMCTGRRNTAVLADAAAVLHRTRPHVKERLALTFTYTSRAPFFPALSRDPRLDGELTAAQTECMYASDQPD